MDTLIATYVRQARKRAGLTQTQLGDALNVTKGNISAWECGRHSPGIEQLGRIAQITGEPIPLTILNLDAGQYLAAPGGGVGSVGLVQTPGYYAAEGGATVDVLPGHHDTFAIPHMNGRARGGIGGLAPAHEYVVGSISVTESWLHRRLPAITSKANLRVIEAYGRSMEPTLQSGDLLVVDTGISQANIDGIYILMRQNTPEPEIMVKRLQRTLDGGLIVRSDNRTEYDPEVVPSTDIATKIRILGRVVWIWAGREA